MIRIISVLLILLFSFGAAGQELFFESLTPADGMPSTLTFSTYQDRCGFLWISTREGLTRYDSYDFRTYYSGVESDVSLNDVCAFYEDKDDVLWVVSGDGTLHRYDRHDDVFRVVPMPLAGGWVQNTPHDIIADDTGHLWVSGYGGIQRYDIETDSVLLVPMEEVRTPNWPYPEKVRCQSMILLADSIMVIGTRKFGLLKYTMDSDSVTYYRERSDLAGRCLDDGISDIVKIPNGNLLVADGGNGGLIEWNPYDEYIVRRLQSGSLDERGVAIYTHDIHLDTDTTCWIATEHHGIMRINMENDYIMEHYRSDANQRLSLGADHVLHINKDRNGTLWLGANALQQGSPRLYRFRDLLHSPSDAQSLPHNEIFRMQEYHDGRLLLSTRVGAALYDPSTSAFEYPLPYPDNDQRTFGVLTKADGSVLISTYDYLYHLDRDMKTIMASYHRDLVVDELSTTFKVATDILEDSEGRIWTMDYWGRLKCIEPSGVSNFMTLAQDTITDRFINVLDIIDLPDYDLILVATDFGLATVGRTSKKVDFLRPKYEDYDLYRSRYSYLYTDHLDRLWTVVDGYPYIYDFEKNHITPLPILSQHDVGSITWIEESPDSMMWFGTPKGIIGYDERSQTSALYPSDNIGGDNWSSPSPVLKSGGKIYFSGSRGLSILDPRSTSAAKESSSIFISELYVNQQLRTRGVDRNNDIQLALNYEENDIDVLLTDFAFLDQEKIDYQYRLLPLDQDWKSNGASNRVRLNNLAPGSYTLRLRAVTDDNSTPKPVSIGIYISPPWWQTMWVRMLALVMLIMGVASLVRYRYQQQIIREREIQRLRTKISNDLHDDVGTVLTGLAMQSELLSTTLPPEHSTMIERIMDRSRTAITQMRDIVWAMDASKDTMGDLLDRIMDHADYSVEGAGKDYNMRNQSIDKHLMLKPNVKQAAYLITKETITNFCKHSDGDCIDINIVVEGKILKMSIKDNGPERKKVSKSGIGLQSMRRRAEVLGGSYTFLYDEDGGYHTLAILPL